MGRGVGGGGLEALDNHNVSNVKIDTYIITITSRLEHDPLEHDLTLEHDPLEHDLTLG